MLNILIIEKFFVPLYTWMSIFRFVLMVWLLMPSVGAAQERATLPFNTVGYGYNKPKLPTAREDKMSDDMDEDDEETDESNMTNPSADSLRAYMPLVALPLKRIHINSPYGVRRDPMNRRNARMHSGIDLRARYEEVYSMLPGVVTAASYSANGGYYVTVNHGACVCSYLHLSKILVKKGERVSAGQVFAISGNSGKRTTGPHLHLSCRWGNEKGKYFNPMLVLGFVSEQLLDKK